MNTATKRFKDRSHRGLTVSLVGGIVLSMGPLFGAIVSVFIMMYRTAEAREMASQGLTVEVVPFPLMPVIIGFCAFPVGLALVCFSVIRLSHHVTRQRQKHITKGKSAPC